MLLLIGQAGGAPVVPAPPTPPLNTVAPVASGSSVEGSVLSSTNGSWTGTAPITFAFQWQADGVDIPGETAATITTISSDVGKVIRRKTTATNSVGSAVAYSNGITVTAIPSGAFSNVLSVGGATWDGATPTTNTLSPTGASYT